MIVVKRCSCGRTFDAAAWDALPLVGHFREPADEHGPELRLEMRNCPCGSTIARDLAEEARTAELARAALREDREERSRRPFAWAARGRA